MWIRTDTTLDQDCGTESDSVCMYTVQCRVIADNKCEFQQILKIEKKSIGEGETGEDGPGERAVQGRGP